MKSFLELEALIAAEYHVSYPMDTTPIFKYQFMASLAENRRNDRQKAAAEGKIYVG
jgi:hypothetical protein